MQPVLVEIPYLGLKLHSFGVVAMLAFVAGIALASWRASDRDAYSFQFMLDLGLVCLISAIIGSRIFYVLENYDQFSWVFLRVTEGGFSIPGVLAGAAVPVLLYILLFPDADRLFTRRSLAVLGGISVVSAVIGGRAIYFYFHIETYPAAFSPIAVWKGGIVFYGGLIGGALGAIGFIRYHGHSVLEVGDLLAAPVLLAQFIARWSCFLAGDDYGTRVGEEFPLAIRFPRQAGETAEQALVYLHHIDFGWISPDAAYSDWVHPTQLYMSGGVFLCFLLLMGLERRNWFNGFSMGMMFLLYSIHRFIVEFFRGDPVAVIDFSPIPALMQFLGLPQVTAGTRTLYGLRISQFVSFLLLLVAIGFLLYLWFRKADETPDTSPSEPETAET